HEEWAKLSRADVGKSLKAEARALYARKEAEFPIQVGLTRYLADRSHNQSPRNDRDGLAAWATQRLGVYIDPDELRPLLRPEIDQLLEDVARKNYPGERISGELDAKVGAAFGADPAE